MSYKWSGLGVWGVRSCRTREFFAQTGCVCKHTIERVLDGGCGRIGMPDELGLRSGWWVNGRGTSWGGQDLSRFAELAVANSIEDTRADPVRFAATEHEVLPRATSYLRAAKDHRSGNAAPKKSRKSRDTLLPCRRCPHAKRPSCRTCVLQRVRKELEGTHALHTVVLPIQVDKLRAIAKEELAGSGPAAPVVCHTPNFSCSSLKLKL